MGVISSNTFSDGYTPICNCCGIVLCWDIDEYEYEERKQFWDNWRCQNCDEHAVGSRQKYIQENQ